MDNNNVEHVWTWYDVMRTWGAALLAPGVPAGLLTWYFTRRDTLSERKSKTAQIEAEREAKERERQDAVDAAQIARMIIENDRKQVEIDRRDVRIGVLESDLIKARREADRGWWLARYWWNAYGRLHSDVTQYRHDMRGFCTRAITALQIVVRNGDKENSAAVKAAADSSAVEVMPRITLVESVPDLEDPKPLQ